MTFCGYFLKGDGSGASLVRLFSERSPNGKNISCSFQPLSGLDSERLMTAMHSFFWVTFSQFQLVRLKKKIWGFDCLKKKKVSVSGEKRDDLSPFPLARVTYHKHRALKQEGAQICLRYYLCSPIRTRLVQKAKVFGAWRRNELHEAARTQSMKTRLPWRWGHPVV